MVLPESDEWFVLRNGDNGVGQIPMLLISWETQTGGLVRSFFLDCCHLGESFSASQNLRFPTVIYHMKTPVLKT